MTSIFIVVPAKAGTHSSVLAHQIACNKHPG